MKELHNDIFSNTTCISKEIMLKYINKQLSESELHEVEKHMIDCDLCTDAIAGMEFAKDSSMLFVIDHQIDKQVGKGGGKSTVLKKLMVAASILIVVAGSYFTLRLFNNTNTLEGELALNNVDKKEDKQSLVEERFILSAPQEINKENEKRVEEIPPITQPKLVSIPQELETYDVAQDEIEDEEVLLEINANGINSNNKNIIVTEDELDVDLSELNEEMDYEGDIFEPKTISSEDKLLNSSNKDGINSYGYYSSNLAKGTVDSEVLEFKKVSKSRKKRSLKKEKHVPKNAIYILDYKVYDYTFEYEQEEKLKQSAKPRSVSPAYSTREDQDKERVEQEQHIVKITYSETLESGIRSFKGEQYQEALLQFNLILSKHPKDVNALFYGGLSLYKTNNYENALNNLEKVLKNNQDDFNQEAEWYSALTLIALKKDRKAKKRLERIINNEGFYKEKATEQLQKMN